MGFFKTEAKARRKEELQEQHKKETAVPAPYFHTPTHALKDSLQSVSDINKGTDHQRLKEAHRLRLQKEAIALATGSDTNATSIPANYWQGQPLPAQFKAPTPADLRKLALSRSTIRGKNIALPEALLVKKQSQKTVDDEGYASGDELKSMARRFRQSQAVAGPSRLSVTAQPQRDEAIKAAEAAREAELERLRNRVRELEAERMGKQNGHVGLADRPTVLTRAPANNASHPVNGIQGGASSSSRWGSQSSAQSCGKDSQSQKQDDESSPPSTPPSRDSDGVARYDWAMHWVRLAAATDEERDSLPPAVNPQQCLAQGEDPEARADPQPYDSYAPRFGANCLSDLPASLAVAKGPRQP
ncbi:hypothetical protein KVR01_002835 [Diaporthe batatas]|uniref:uncharacterized protein n=1 Tax=Diaporthe batatas TaxID=748121 RepID=UPI001D056BBF|nr:uncharacterized protein KVR01_002835 [Diaporthe batatas]KAG8167146.1 hypothetical protein KVR01_002835 [Diaporthe batatas]